MPTCHPQTPLRTLSCRVMASRCACLAFLLTALLVPAVASGADTVRSGTGGFRFEDSAGRTVGVWYYAPSPMPADTPVLFVMHGVKRNGRDYRDAWAETARKRRILLLVPEFSEAGFPGSENYNLGGVVTGKWEPTEIEDRAFTTIERIFDRVTSDLGLNARTYSIFGHSAGAQFVHRMVLFAPGARFDKAVAANAGWYTMPDFSVRFPYGLSGAPSVTEKEAARALGREVVILLGLLDTNEKDPNLNTSEGAMAQGRHRLERGLRFHKQATREAERLGVRLGWTVLGVPGVGHSNSGMIPAAVKALF